MHTIPAGRRLRQYSKLRLSWPPGSESWVTSGGKCTRCGWRPAPLRPSPQRPVTGA